MSTTRPSGARSGEHTHLPTWLVVHHVCGVKACCHPWHLDLITPSEHSLTHAWLRAHPQGNPGARPDPTGATFHHYICGTGRHASP